MCHDNQAVNQRQIYLQRAGIEDIQTFPGGTFSGSHRNEDGGFTPASGFQSAPDAIFAVS